MDRTFRISLCLCIIALLTGCGSQRPSKSPFQDASGSRLIATAKYDISLIAVDKFTANAEPESKRGIGTGMGEGSPGFAFDDETVKIIWKPAPIDIIFTLSNKTDQALRIAWDEAKFIDEKGAIHRLNHSGIGYEESNLSQSPTVIAPGHSLEDFVHPADCFQWVPIRGLKSAGQDGYWDRAPFLPTQINGAAEELKAQTNALIGRTFQVVLPLATDKVQIGYRFTFRINHVDISAEMGKKEQTDGTPDGRRDRNERKNRKPL